MKNGTDRDKIFSFNTYKSYWKHIKAVTQEQRKSIKRAVIDFGTFHVGIPKVKGKACCFHRSACLKAFVQPLTFYTVLFEVEYFIGMFTKYLIERKKIRKRKMVTVEVFHSLTNAVKCLFVFFIVKLDIHC